MSSGTVSRRDLFRLTSAAALVGAVTPRLEAEPAAALPGYSDAIGDSLLSIPNGYAFLDLMMDAWASGSTIRLAQSYSDQALNTAIGFETYLGNLPLGPLGLVYDNAMAIHAYLARGDAAGLARANQLGQGLLYAQTHNYPAFLSGGWVQAYQVNVPDSNGTYITPTLANIEGDFYNYSPVRLGDLLWVGLALLQLYARNGNSQYLTAAVNLGNFIVVSFPPNAYNTSGFLWGLITDEYNGTYLPAPYGKSTEFNIVAVAFFYMLSHLTNGGGSGNLTPWSSYAQFALTFVGSLFQPNGPYYNIGTVAPNQTTIIGAPGPTSCQCWAYLASIQPQASGAIDWTLTNLATKDTAAAPNSSLTGSRTVSGLTYDESTFASTTDDPKAVWLEGTSIAASALIARALRGESLLSILNDLANAVALLAQCSAVQRNLGGGQTVAGKPIPAGLGLVASSSVADTGQGYVYGPWLHLGATSWYLLASLAANPFQIGYRS